MNSHLLNEIMPMIYKRFTEKTAEEWRQIYKVRPTPSLKRTSVGEIWKLTIGWIGTSTPRIPHQARLRTRCRRCPIPLVPDSHAPSIPLYRYQWQGSGYQCPQPISGTSQVAWRCRRYPRREEESSRQPQQVRRHGRNGRCILERWWRRW